MHCVEANFEARLAFTPRRPHHAGVNCALLILLAAIVMATTNPTATVKSRVVLARDPTAVNGLRVDTPKIRPLLAAGIQALTGKTNEVSAWRSIFTSKDVVGIKISTLAGPLHSTHREVVNAIAAGLVTAGVTPTNIIVWDRDPRKMRDAEWTTDANQSSHAYRVSSVIGGSGWDTQAAYENRVVGKLIWGDLEFGAEEALGTRSHLPKLLTQTITKLISVPVLMNHDACGMAGCLYNVTLAAVDNTRRFEQFGMHGDPMIPEIYASFPQIRNNLVLNIMDALVGGYAGGPAFKPQYSWPYGGLYFSFDPVAVDAVCLGLLETQRKASHVPAIGANANHIITAGKAGLGQSDRANIELIEVKP